MTRPIVWTIAGTDSGGGAGIAADLRAAAACGVHLCTAVAAVTAQHSTAVTHVHAVSDALLDAQLAALAQDMPPLAIKTGLLGSVHHVETVARWVDRLRVVAPVALIVDPVLGSSTGTEFADEAIVCAYRRWLLPRATVLTPNLQEAMRLVGHSHSAPRLAAALRGFGARSVCVTGGDGVDGLALDWLDTPQARGWLALPRVATHHHHGTGCFFASAVAASMAQGSVAADALVLAKMATAQALRQGYAAGAGAGPVGGGAGFVDEPTLMPQLSWCERPRFARFNQAPEQRARMGLYGIADSARRVDELISAGVRTVQLRIKHHAMSETTLRRDVARTIARCAAARVMLFVNDHVDLAIELGSPGLHLGQEDILALTHPMRQRLATARRRGMALGISSHAPYELARARSLAPTYVACGPVWPTTTKKMNWRPQGLANLSWWCRVAGAPVVAIGGILLPSQAASVMAAGATAACVVRGFGDALEVAVPAFLQAIDGEPASGRSTIRA